MRIYVFFVSLICLFVLQSCHTSRRSTAHRSRKPQFLDDVYMGRHNKNSATADAIDKSVQYPEKRHSQKKHSGVTKTPENPIVKNTGTPQATASKKEEKGLLDKYAGMLGVTRREVTNYPLYRFIDEWYGTNYCMGGTEKTGIDCSGFVQKLYTQVFGVDIVRSSYEQFSNCEHLRKADAAIEGDLVFFKTRGHKISHVGVYLMNDYFVHSSTTQGVMISSLKEEYWHKHFAGVGRITKG